MFCCSSDRGWLLLPIRRDRCCADPTPRSMDRRSHSRTSLDGDLEITHTCLRATTKKPHSPEGEMVRNGPVLGTQNARKMPPSGAGIRACVKHILLGRCAPQRGSGSTDLALDERQLGVVRRVVAEQSSGLLLPCRWRRWRLYRNRAQGEENKGERRGGGSTRSDGISQHPPLSPRR